MHISLINQNHNSIYDRIAFMSTKSPKNGLNKNAVKNKETAPKLGMEDFIADVFGKIKQNNATSEYIDEDLTESIYNSEIVEEPGTDGEVHITLEKTKTEDRNKEIRADNVLKMYFAQIKDIPVLSAEEEYEIAKKAYDENDENARQALINSNLKFVVSVAKKYMHKGLPLVDLIQEGNVGLINASQTFDYTKGFKFISYAVWYIESEIRHALAEKARTIEIPEYIRSLIHNVKKTTVKLAVELGRSPTVSEISERSGISEAKLQTILRTTKPIKSLEESIDSDDNDSRKLIDTIQSDSGILSREILESKEEDSFYVQAMLSKLKPKEKEVLTLKYGINREFPVGIDEIAKILGLSRTRVKVIERNAMTKLRLIAKK